MHRFTSIFCTIMLALGTSSVAATEALPDELLVPAAKIDSGLGELPHASQWQGMPWLHATPAEKIDSGLGELATRATEQLTRAP